MSTVVVVREESGAIRVLADRCSHMGGPLSEGEITDGCIRCPGTAAPPLGRLEHNGPGHAPQPALLGAHQHGGDQDRDHGGDVDEELRRLQRRLRLGRQTARPVSGNVGAAGPATRGATTRVRRGHGSCPTVVRSTEVLHRPGTRQDRRLPTQRLPANSGVSIT
ncbi:Rieske 2Fe-2S domain-containing protein [Streptomyces sp. NPDC058619]|uniref:Rieske 2Fe-2S domain-containing protein n=1 Tax=unclassified Streptomyces TaxID=2593676 RepID=UPI00364BD8E8